MKKSRVSVFALLAILFAMSSAFVTKTNAEAAAKRDPSYYWFNASSVYQMQNTVSAEASRTGCNSGAINCEAGYNASQLKNPSQPAQGVKTGETPPVQIHKLTN